MKWNLESSYHHSIISCLSFPNLENYGSAISIFKVEETMIKARTMHARLLKEYREIIHGDCKGDAEYFLVTLVYFRPSRMEPFAGHIMKLFR
jgi:hypothetical protein